MIDLGNEEIQREPKTGPVPAGSRVLVGIEIEKPQYAAHDDPFVAEGKSGLRRLQCKVKVMSGTYDGCWWYEGITLPEAHQKFVFLFNDEMALFGDDVKHVEAAGSETRHTVDAGIGFAVLEALVDVHGNPEQLSDLAARIAESLPLLSKTCSGFLSFFGGSRRHDGFLSGRRHEPAPGLCRRDSNVEEEIHDIAVSDDVVFALGAHFSSFLRRRLIIAIMLLSS